MIRTILALGVVAGLLSSPTSAAPIPCGGTDLVARVESETPETYAALAREAAQMKNGDGLLWRIDGRGVAPSYLFGTIHFTDRRVHAFSDETLAALNAASAVAVETLAVLSSPLDTASPEAAAMTQLADGKTLDDVLPGDVRDALKNAMTARLMVYEGFATMKPWLVMQLLSYPPCELASIVTDNAIVDRNIAKRAKEAGKELIGLETEIEQFSSFDSIPMAAQIEMLRASAMLSYQVDDVHETFVQLYRRGDVGMIEVFSRHLMGDDFDPAAYEAFMEGLLHSRNLRMRDRARPHVEKGGVFIAVGALHLPGDTGLIELFRKEGFTVTRVE